MIIAKFGGTSVGSAENIRNIVEIARNSLAKEPILVVSAVSGVTNLLLGLASERGRTSRLKKIRQLHIRLINELLNGNSASEMARFLDKQLSSIETLLSKKALDKAQMDRLASFGEIISASLVSHVFNQVGIKAEPVLATEMIITDNNFGSAEVRVEPTKSRVARRLTKLTQKGVVPVVTGFIGSTRDGQTTTLGRGGSDYSASILGFCVKASEIQIWTDVDGIFSADPRLVSHAYLISQISFREASELAYFGAKVLHPRTIRPAIQAQIPVRVLNTFNPEAEGTLILKKLKSGVGIKAISSKSGVTLVNIYSTEMLLSKGFLSRIFDAFAKAEISVDLVTVSEVSISVTLDNDDTLSSVIKALSKFAQVSVQKNMGIITLVGEGITASTKTTAQIFSTLDQAKILTKMVSLGASDINISLVLASNQVEDALVLLHQRLLENQSEVSYSATNNHRFKEVTL